MGLLIRKYMYLCIYVCMHYIYIYIYMHIYIYIYIYHRANVKRGICIRKTYVGGLSHFYNEQHSELHICACHANKLVYIRTKYAYIHRSNKGYTYAKGMLEVLSRAYNEQHTYIHTHMHTYTGPTRDMHTQNVCWRCLAAPTTSSIIETTSL